MLDNLEIEEQREKLVKVIKYLKSTGISQKEMASKIKVDNVYMSHLRSGTIKYITPEVLNGLKKSYKINPKYITHGASNMFDCFLQVLFGQSCKIFLDIVACPNWTKLQSGGQSCLD